LEGYDVYEGTPNAAGTGDPRSGHGTHVAGTVIGERYRGTLPTGVARESYVIPIQLFDKNGFANLASFYKALSWIYTDMLTKPKGRFVINLSLCKPDQASDNQGQVKRVDVQHRIDQIIAGNGVICAAACNAGEKVAGNMFGNYPGVFVVGSNPADKTKLSWFSGWDSNVDVHMQGEKIWAASNKNDVDNVKKSGTSMATPYISGVFAKLWEIHPEKNTSAIIQYFNDNCVDDIIVQSPPTHIKCTKGNRICPTEITPRRVNVELPNCLTGVVVQCPEEPCSLAQIADLYCDG
jgi:subtilisin